MSNTRLTGSTAARSSVAHLAIHVCCSLGGVAVTRSPRHKTRRRCLRPAQGRRSVDADTVALLLPCCCPLLRQTLCFPSNLVCLLSAFSSTLFSVRSRLCPLPCQTPVPEVCESHDRNRRPLTYATSARHADISRCRERTQRHAPVAAAAAGRRDRSPPASPADG